MTEVTITDMESLVLDAIKARHETDGLGATVPEVALILGRGSIPPSHLDVAIATEKLIGVQRIMVHKLPQRGGWPVWKVRTSDSVDDEEDGDLDDDE